ncbi:MAG: ribonuclease Z [Chlamydiia bacterium]|nr:ribonuclease Z [Chlamydiia bacterium]
MSVRDLTILGCSSQQPTRRYNHGAYLLRWNGCGFLIDPGEGTQRQFIYADIAPTAVTHIFVSHFHGDHCLGLGSMLMRLNLDQVKHPIHCYYPASGKRYFDRLRFGTIYHNRIEVIEHPVKEEGIVECRDGFTIEAYFLEHRVDNLGWRITEDSERKFDRKQLEASGVRGPLVGELQTKGKLLIDGKTVSIDDVSYVRQGDIFASVLDTRPCAGALKAAKNATMLLCESTYAQEDHALALRNFHLTASEAAELALEASVDELVLTHYSARYLDFNVLLREARKIFPNTHLAEDFKVIPFPKTFKKAAQS